MTTSQSMAASSRGVRLYKLVILGDGGVGKSALVIQFVSHRFLEYHDPTIEDSYQQQARIDGEPAKLDILDTAGQPEFTAMREQYMRKGEGFILCYSITDRRSFDEIMQYKKLIERVRCQEDIPLVIVGNKCDLEDRRQVRTEEGMALAQRLGCKFYETSAVLRQCVDDVFHEIIRDIRHRERDELMVLEKQSKKKHMKKQIQSFFERLNVFKKPSHSSADT